MTAERIEREGVTWIKLGAAAKLSRTKATVIAEAIQNEAIPSLIVEGHTYVPLTAANRLKRETSFMRSVARKTHIGDTVPANGRVGPLSAHREKQQVLPISSGRRGRDWKG